MRRILPLAAILAVAACGRSDEEALHDAAEQSDPAAARVLENAAEAGVDPQQALEAAGRAQVAANDVQRESTLQARPNLPGNSNPPQPGQPPEKIDVQRDGQ